MFKKEILWSIDPTLLAKLLLGAPSKLAMPTYAVVFPIGYDEWTMQVYILYCKRAINFMFKE